MSRPIRHIPGADAYQLYEETPLRPTHTVKVLVLDRSRDAPLTLGQLRAHVESRVASIAPLRWVPVTVPGKLFHPVWVDRGVPDLEALVVPLTDGELGESWFAVAGTLASSPLPRGLPLWRIWLMPQTNELPGAIFMQLHHSLADGHASARLLEALFGSNFSSVPDEIGCALLEPTPSRGRLMRSATGALARAVAHFPRHIARSVAGARREHVKRDPSMRSAAAFQSPALPWARPLAPGRRVAWASLPLAEVHRVRAPLNVTVGEIVLAIVSGATRAHLAAVGSLPRSSLTAVVPVGSPDWSEARSGNRNRHTFVSLHTDVIDPVDRAKRLSAEMRVNRRRVTQESIDRWAGWMDYYPLFRALYVMTVLPMGRIFHKPPASMIVSTVRGPREQLTIAGARVMSLYSVGVLTEYLGLNVTVWSYENQLGFAVSCATPSGSLAEEIAKRLPAAFEELAAASTSVMPV